MKSIVKSVLGAVLVGALASGAAFAKMAPNAEACTAKNEAKVVSLGEEYHNVFVEVSYIDDETGETWPAKGVHIFEAESNRLLGITREDGKVEVRVRHGASIRAVEPQYGEQQYQGEPIYNDKGEIIGWKAPSK